MKTKALSPQYLFDSSGKKSFVVLSIKEYEELLEDLRDLSIMAERRDEPKMSIEEFEKGLKTDGLLSN
jgi:PHD/YefM family antitoxin component YafN of YafNO toxin-antitoxin module